MNQKAWHRARTLILPFACLAVVAACLWWWLGYCRWQTTVLLVRHADRNPGVDQLNAAGTTRAQELVHVAEKANVTAIYHTEAARTRQTAQPLADRLGITPTQVPAADARGVAVDILAHHRNEVVLVVGHSNTLPQIIAALGGPALPDIPEDEFDNLYVVRICACVAKQRAVNLQYGAASPGS